MWNSVDKIPRRGRIEFYNGTVDLRSRLHVSWQLQFLTNTLLARLSHHRHLEPEQLEECSRLGQPSGVRNINRAHNNVQDSISKLKNN